MKYKVVIDKEREEEVVIYSHDMTPFVKELCEFIDDNMTEFTAYDVHGILNIKTSDIYAFLIEDSKLYAITDSGKYRINGRLYQIEESVGDGFVKINQSCIVNIKRIERFDTTIYGVLTVKMQNGFKDYVSRRQMKAVKERIKK